MFSKILLFFSARTKCSFCENVKNYLTLTKNFNQTTSPTRYNWKDKPISFIWHLGMAPKVNRKALSYIDQTWKAAAASTQTWYSTLRTGTAGSWRRKRRPWTWWNTKAWGSCYTRLPWQSPDRASSTGNYRWPSFLTSWGPLKPLAIWPQWLSTTLSDSRWCPGTTLRTQKFDTPVTKENNEKVTRSTRTPTLQFSNLADFSIC